MSFLWLTLLSRYSVDRKSCGRGHALNSTVCILFWYCCLAAVRKTIYIVRFNPTWHYNDYGQTTMDSKAQSQTGPLIQSESCLMNLKEWYIWEQTHHLILSCIQQMITCIWLTRLSIKYSPPILLNKRQLLCSEQSLQSFLLWDCGEWLMWQSY